MEKQILILADDAFQGNINPLEAYVRLKKIEKSLKAAIESVQPLAIEEAYEKYAEKNFSAYGATVEKKRAPGKWDYTGVRPWVKAKEELAKYEEMAKEAYKMSIRNQSVVDDNTGEVITPAVYTEGRDSITIKIE